MSGTLKYKRVVLVISLWQVCIFCWSQTTAWDSTYRPNLFWGKVGQFKSFTHSPKDFVFLGNSITMGTDWNELLQISNAKNRGISGDISFGVLERLEEVIHGHPAKIFILIGINDIARNIPDSVVVQNYLKIIQRIKSGSPSSKIYFHTLLPVNNTFRPALPHFNKNEHILWVNNELKKIAKREKIGLIDLYAAFVNSEQQIDKQYTYDGLHLNDKGYFKWSSIIKDGGYLK